MRNEAVVVATVSAAPHRLGVVPHVYTMETTYVKVVSGDVSHTLLLYPNVPVSELRGLLEVHTHTAVLVRRPPF